MPCKQAKQGNKDRDASDGASNAASVSPTHSTGSIANASHDTTSSSINEALLKTITTAVANEGQRIVQSVNVTMGKLESKFDCMAKRIDDVAAATAALVARQTEAETRISSLEDNINPIKRRLDALEKTNKELREKVLDQECRQRRMNIRLLNLQESTEGNDPLPFFEEFIPKLLQLPVPSVQLDRAHRGFGLPRDGRPRPVVVKVQYSRDLTMILEAVKRHGNLQHKGCPIRIVRDIPPEVRAARRAFNTVCMDLIKRNIRFRMAFPAILSFKANGVLKTFKDSNEAEAFVSTIK